MGRKKKRMASSGDNNPQPNKKRREELPLALADLNFDCLTYIFGTFSIKDLVNVVEADGRLITAARYVFRKVYGSSAVEVSNEFDPKAETPSMSVKIIEHFSDMIAKLKVIYHKKYCRYNDMVDDIILDKCLKYLTEIEIENGDQLVFHKITQPFEQLRRISFVSSNVPDVILCFEKWFPNVHTLELKKLKIEKKIENGMFTLAEDENESYSESRTESDSESRAESDSESRAESEPENRAENEPESRAESESESRAESESESRAESESESRAESDYGFYGKPIAALAKKYPTVQHFAISNVPEIFKCDNRVRNRDVQKFIELNPQLKSLFIESDDVDHYNEEIWVDADYRAWSYDGIEIESELADCIQQKLPNLENFHLIWKTGESNEGCEFHFENLKTLTIEYEIRSGHFYVGTDNVDVLNIVAISPRDFGYGNCVDLLQWNKSATIVNITGSWCGKRDATKAFKNFNEMPNLKELQFVYDSEVIKKEMIISLLDSCKPLTKLRLDSGGSIKLFKKASKNFDTDVDLVASGWAIVSRKNRQLVFERITET